MNTAPRRSDDDRSREAVVVIAVSMFVMAVTFLGGLYLLVRFVKWAWGA